MGTQTKAQLETRILELEKQISTVEAESFPINLWINVSEQTGSSPFFLFGPSSPSGSFYLADISTRADQ